MNELINDKAFCRAAPGFARVCKIYLLSTMGSKSISSAKIETNTMTREGLSLLVSPMRSCTLRDSIVHSLHQYGPVWSPPTVQTVQSVHSTVQSVPHCTDQLSTVHCTPHSVHTSCVLYLTVQISCLLFYCTDYTSLYRPAVYCGGQMLGCNHNDLGPQESSLVKEGFSWSSLTLKT